MKKIIFLISFAVLLSGLVIGSGYVVWRLFLGSPPVGAPTKTFEIKSGEGAGQVGKRLAQAGLLQDQIDYWLFRFYVERKNLAGKLQAGIFEVKSGQSIAALARYLINPQWAEQELRFLEGWTIRDYSEYLVEQGVAQKGELESLVGAPATDYRFVKDLPPPKDFSQDYDFLADKPLNLSLEGYLFPDTYRLRKIDNLETIARRLLNNFGQKLDADLRAEIRRQGKSIFEIVTMASILEKEARTTTDRKLIADILWRRLSIGMPLQVDSSVNYVTGKSVPAVSIAETKIESLYNTYKFSGLPLGPITNPGLDSIKAAIYPQANDFWFFLADKEGTVHYSKTLDEHNRKKAMYLK